MVIVTPVEIYAEVGDVRMYNVYDPSLDDPSLTMTVRVVGFDSDELTTRTVGVREELLLKLPPAEAMTIAPLSPETSINPAPEITMV